MRTLSASLFSTADGIVDNPQAWQFDSFDADLSAMMSAVIATLDTAILGRVTFEQWSQWWPSSSPDDPFAAFINPVEKVVVSRTLRDPLEWTNSHLIDGELVTAVAALKERDGAGIAVQGSLSVTRQLLLAGLLDTLTLVVHPVMVGAGRRLLEPNDPVIRLQLVDQERTRSGTLVNTYARGD